MKHYNENILCAIDVETTGLNPRVHEMVQIAILPLDTRFKMLTDIVPFNIYLRPYRPQCADPVAMKVNGLQIPKLLRDGFGYEESLNLFEKWFDQLNLRPHADGAPRQIMPLGHNYGFDKSFIVAWMGQEMYDRHFHWHIRDTLSAASYLKDRFGLFGYKDPLPKISLSYLCTCLKIKRQRKHDALQDCVATAEVYRKITKLFIPNQVFNPKITTEGEIIQPRTVLEEAPQNTLSPTE